MNKVSTKGKGLLHRDRERKPVLRNPSQSCHFVEVCGSLFFNLSLRDKKCHHTERILPSIGLAKQLINFWQPFPHIEWPSLTKQINDWFFWICKIWVFRIVKLAALASHSQWRVLWVFARCMYMYLYVWWSESAFLLILIDRMADSTRDPLASRPTANFYCTRSIFLCMS